MDTLSGHSFPAHVPFKDPLVIAHFTFMILAFFLCYPLVLLLPQQQYRQHQLYLRGALCICASLGFITAGYLIVTVTTSIVFQLLILVLLCLFYFQIVIIAYQSNEFMNHLLFKNMSIPEWIHVLLSWMIFITALNYLTVAIFVEFTGSCSTNNNTSQHQCLAPVLMGNGFLIYGTCVLLHLLAIVKLPRLSTPEYYEAVIITSWGFISLLFSDVSILGSSWRAINLGLLWFSGGLFSIISSVQTWIPALREKNIINSIILFLTGRAIVRGITQTNDSYYLEVHTMLGYIFMIGAAARISQIVFRKSPVYNLPHRMFLQHSTDTPFTDDDEDDQEEASDTLLFFKKETNTKNKCKHHFMFASITLIAGILTSFLTISGGLLLMGANVGWIQYMRYYIKDPSTYVNAILACAFLWCAYLFGLCTLYKTLKLHPYDYLNRHQPVTAESKRRTIITANTTSDDDEERREWNYFYEEPTDIPLTASTPYHTNVFDNNTTATMTESDQRTLRPSEYRAKRRSLLLATNNTSASSMVINTTKNRSSFGAVGGILPDEIIANNPVSPLRKSWLSSDSSSSGMGYYSGSSAPNSPPLDSNLPYASISSTLPHSYVYRKQRERSNSEASYYLDKEDEEARFVHKTKSGKRKDRLQNVKRRS